MKALTITQPWAQLIAIGAKRLETRSWQTSYRGRVAIHAAKGFPGLAKDLCYARRVLEALGWPTPEGGINQPWMDDINARVKALPLGSVMATARLVGCFRTDGIQIGTSLGVIADCGARITEHEYGFGNYDPGRFAWLLTDIKPLPVPIPAKGALGLWEWNPEASNV